MKKNPVDRPLWWALYFKRKTNQRTHTHTHTQPLILLSKSCQLKISHSDFCAANTSGIMKKGVWLASIKNDHIRFCFFPLKRTHTHKRDNWKVIFQPHACYRASQLQMIDFVKPTISIFQLFQSVCLLGGFFGSFVADSWFHVWNNFTKNVVLPEIREDRTQFTLYTYMKIK